MTIERTKISQPLIPTRLLLIPALIGIYLVVKGQGHNHPIPMTAALLIVVAIILGLYQQMRRRLFERKMKSFAAARGAHFFDTMRTGVLARSVGLGLADDALIVIDNGAVTIVPYSKVRDINWELFTGKGAGEASGFFVKLKDVDVPEIRFPIVHQDVARMKRWEEACRQQFERMVWVAA